MQDTLNNLVRQLTADKKKLAVMICLCAVGLLLWGRLLIKDVPRTATAVPNVTAAASAPAQPAAEAQQDAGRQPAVTVVVDLPTTLTRDMFALDTTGYRVVKKDEIGTSGPKDEPDTPDKAYRLARATEAARKLSVEGVLLGEFPSVIINGQMLQEGQKIAGFEVYRIENRTVVLEMDGVHIRLGM